MRRRRFIGVLGGVAGWPFMTSAQQKPIPLIGILGSASADDPAVAANLDAFRRGLNEAGFVEGQNVAIEYRWANSQQQRLPALAAELVALQFDAIMIEGGTPSALAAKNATSTIPIVFHAADAIADGLVTNLARPGGNLTGVSLLGSEGLIKQFELCVELLPAANTIGLLVMPRGLIGSHAVGMIEEAARAKRVELHFVDVVDDRELETVFTAFGRLRAGVVVRAHVTHANKIIATAARHAVPTVFNQRAFVASGALISYGPSIPAAYVIKGVYTGRILKGAKPAELPVQQSTTLELIINLKAASELGVSVPASLLARADEVIE